MFKILLCTIFISSYSLTFAADWHTLEPTSETMDMVANIDNSWQQKYPIIKQIKVKDIGIPKSGISIENSYTSAINNQFNINNDALTFILTTLESDVDVATAAIKYVQYLQQFIFTNNQNNLLPYYKNLRIADSCIVILKIKNHLNINLIDQQILSIINKNPEVAKLYNEHYSVVMASWPSYGYDFWGAKELCFKKAY